MAIPVYTSRLRLIALIYGGLLLLWTSLEDNSVLPVAILGVGLALILIAFWITRRFSRRNLNNISAALIGAAVGALGALMTALLMLIKVGLHSHLYPDYPFGLIGEMLLRLPLWGIAGAFAGIGLLLAWKALQAEKS